MIAVMRQEGSENKYTSSSLFIHTFDLNTHRLTREVVKTSSDNENFKYITSYPKIDNLVFMYNNSLDSFAYTILDLDSDIEEDTLKNLTEIDGVLRVRVLKGR